MAESDSVIGKKQIIYVKGQAEELSSNDEEDEEETEKEKLEFSKDADQFIWLVFALHMLLITKRSFMCMQEGHSYYKWRI